MKDDDLVARVNASPTYQKLVKTRSSYGWFLTALMMIVYYGFTLLVAFGKGFMSQRIGDSVMTYAFGLFVLLFTIVITGIYVRRANTEFDDLTEALRKEVQQ
jgi:uncharacterized membrane protein (DUF485 family)